MIKIDQPIVQVSVVKAAGSVKAASAAPLLARPESITGTTYKLKTPLSDHALYITINDIQDGEKRRPFEIFIHSAEMEHFQWVVALTRIISAVFRVSPDCGFIAGELRAVFDPRGGYFKPGGKYMPSLVAGIGDILHQHLVQIGAIVEDTSLAEAAKAMVAEKAKPSQEAVRKTCALCGEAQVVILDGCATCLSCGASKCS